MPDKKENLIKIKNDYSIDLLFAEGKINLDQFKKRRSLEKRERWDEVKYIASNPLFLRSFLSKLSKDIRLQVIRALYGYSYKDIEHIGQFGGSISNHFQSKLKKKGTTEIKARLAITLDLPFVFILEDNPSDAERRSYDFIEYQEFGEKVSFEKLKDIIVRPSGRTISGFRIEHEIGSNVLFQGLNNNLNCRVDLHQTFCC